MKSQTAAALNVVCVLFKAGIYKAFLLVDGTKYLLYEILHE